MSHTVELDAPVAAERLFDYLSDPWTRPDWQSSLRTVVDVHGTGEVGTTWRDLTAVGARPAMIVTSAQRPEHWQEAGVWRGLTAHLRLDFTPQGIDRTRLAVTFGVTGAGVLAPSPPCCSDWPGRPSPPTCAAPSGWPPRTEQLGASRIVGGRASERPILTHAIGSPSGAPRTGAQPGRHSLREAARLRAERDRQGDGAASG